MDFLKFNFYFLFWFLTEIMIYIKLKARVILPRFGRISDVKSIFSIVLPLDPKPTNTLKVHN